MREVQIEGTTEGDFERAILAIEQGADGDLYVLTTNPDWASTSGADGRIYRITSP